MNRLRPRHWIGLGLVALVLAIAGYFLAGRYDLRERMAQVVQVIRDAGPLPFFVAMALLPVVGFPLSGFTLTAAPVFGPTMGLGLVILCAVLAITFNVAFSYWLAARGMRPAAEWVVRRFGYELPEVKRDAAWLAIVVLRVVPLTPFSLQGILLGLARVPFGPYMLISVLVPSSYAIAVIVLGDALMRGDPWAIAGAVGMVIFVGVVLHFVRVRVRPKMEMKRRDDGDRHRDQGS